MSGPCLIINDTVLFNLHSMPLTSIGHGFVCKSSKPLNPGKVWSRRRVSAKAPVDHDVQHTNSTQVHVEEYQSHGPRLFV